MLLICILLQIIDVLLQVTLENINISVIAYQNDMDV